MSTGIDGPSRRRTAFPAGLLGMVVLVATIEHQVSRRFLDLSPLVASVYKFASDASRREVHGPSVFCFGDSLNKNTLIPGVIEERTGRRAYNLAITGSTAPYHYFMLRRVLASGERPSAVLVDYNSTLLMGGPVANWRGMTELTTWRECLDLAWHDDSQTGIPLHWLLSRVFPTFEDRDNIRAEILAAFVGQSKSERADILGHCRNWWRNKWAQILPKNPAVLRMPEFWDEKDLTNPAWAGRPANVAYMRRFFETAAAHKVPVYLVVYPTAPRVQRKRQELGIDARYDKVVLSEASRFPNVVVLDGRRMSLSAADFADGSHLDRDGASLVTSAVADAILRYPEPGNAPRVVVLEAPGAASSSTRLEDVTQSTLAVKEALSRLR